MGREDSKRACSGINAANSISSHTTSTDTQNVLLSCFRPLDAFDDEETSWLVPGWIPSGQITLLAADGGVGKTSIWCNLVSAISSGKRCVLDPPVFSRKPSKILFLSAEDSVGGVLKQRLTKAGANLQNVQTADLLGENAELLSSLKFGSSELAYMVRELQPSLCIFDPVQGFIPSEVNMGSRNAMRNCMASLVALGKQTGTAFLVVCHSNKRKGASGRDRIADSADLWDIARSVLMAGFTGESDIRYLSHEKSNYSELQQTRLFNINCEGLVVDAGVTRNRDRDFAEKVFSGGTAPKREECEAWILQKLRDSNGSIPAEILKAQAAQEGFREKTLRNAREALQGEGLITNRQENRTWFVDQMEEA